MNLKCFFCDLNFNNQIDNQFYLKHLLEEHHFVIADIELIANFEKYIEYWSQYLNNDTKAEYCLMIKTNSRPSDQAPSEDYWMLFDGLEKDRKIRSLLHRKHLEEVLQINQNEREATNFEASCLFCQETVVGNRREYFEHMDSEHGFYVGNPDNMVYISELICHLHEKLSQLKCLYCDKIFKDKLVLKEHMRKKGHKRLHSTNKYYDRFYLVNYLELGKDWNSLLEEHDPQLEREFASECDLGKCDDEDDECECDINSHEQVVCLFCDVTNSQTREILRHMEETHHFPLDSMRKDLQLDFYDTLKLVSFIRRKVSNKCCYLCSESFSASESLLAHINDESSLCKQLSERGLPSKELWDKPEYYFSVNSRDVQLCDDTSSSDDDGEEDEPKNSTRRQRLDSTARVCKKFYRTIPAELDPSITESIRNSILKDPHTRNRCLSDS